MKATVVELRYKMNGVLKAFDRNEAVTILYRGKVKGTLVPFVQKKDLKISEHSFFCMFSQDTDKSVLDELDTLRGAMFDDI